MTSSLSEAGLVATAFRLKDGCETTNPPSLSSSPVATAFRLKDGCESLEERIKQLHPVATAFRLKDGYEASRIALSS